MKCKVCGKQPHEIEDCVSYAEEYEIAPEEFVRQNNGTYDPKTETFYCMDCFVRTGMMYKTKNTVRRNTSGEPLFKVGDKVKLVHGFFPWCPPADDIVYEVIHVEDSPFIKGIGYLGMYTIKSDATRKGYAVFEHGIELCEGESVDG